MPIFRYKAKLKNAETILGTIEAQNKEAAIEKINQLGYVPVNVEIQEGAHKDLKRSALRPCKISVEDLYVFTRQLANLIKSGIPILRTLELLSAQSKKPYFKDVLEQIYLKVKDGENLSDCLAKYPLIFSNFYVMMVKAGEESGNLKATLSDLAVYLKDQQEIRSKVRSAVMYPLLMLIFGAGTVCYMLIDVLPKITVIFVNFKQELPWPTQMVMALSDILINSWFWILIVIAAFIAIIKQWDHSKSGRLYKGQVQLGIPVLGDFYLKVELMRFCRTLQLLLKSGIPIVRALQLSVPVIGNELMKDELRKCQVSLLSGESLGASFKQLKYIPALLGDLIVVGEESGSLSTTLNDVAQSYEQETSESVKIMTTLLEPVMILTIGSIIGFIVIAMLLPVFELDMFAR